LHCKFLLIYNLQPEEEVEEEYVEADDGSEDLDGIPLDGSALKAARERLMEEDPDLDGIPR